MEASLRFYVDGLGFKMTKNWIAEGHDSWKPLGKVGEGVTTCFICEDALALYREFKSRGIEASAPFVGNGMGATSVKDPDGYRLEFESETETPEDTQFSESEA